MDNFFGKILCFILALFWILFATSCGNPLVKYYIFEDIEEFEALAETEYSNAKLTVLDTYGDDSDISGLSCLKFFIAEFYSDEVSFEIYAYEFDRTEDSKLYFENATGKKNVADTTFCSSKGVGVDFKSRYELVVIDEERAYKVCGAGQYADEIERCLAMILSKEV